MTAHQGSQPAAPGENPSGAPAERLAGTRRAAAIKAEVAEQTATWANTGQTATLAVVVATDDESTHWYVRSIASQAAKVGVNCIRVDLGAQATEADIAAELDLLSADARVHGIILQTPLPAGVAASRLVSHIPAAKDVDGANPLSLGRLVVGQSAFAPATARAVVELLDDYEIPVAGRHICVVGRSAVVGKPLLHLLLARNATVTIAHSRSKPLADFTRPASVVVVAVGVPGLLTADHVTPGSIVVDVGTNVLADGSLVGDADYDSVAAVAAGVTPVPGGIGGITTALILLHTIEAARVVFD